MSDPNLVVVA